jgi:hypothetical protein
MWVKLTLQPVLWALALGAGLIWYAGESVVDNWVKGALAEDIGKFNAKIDDLQDDRRKTRERTIRIEEQNKAIQAQLDRILDKLDQPASAPLGRRSQ